MIERGTTDADGRFDLATPPASRMWLFFGGFGCPLGARTLPPVDPASSAPVELVCASAPANLEVLLRRAEGGFREGGGVVLRRGDVVFPGPVLAGHLMHFGLAPRSDAQGRLVLAALEPGLYDLYLADSTSAFDILAGRGRGHLSSVALEPLGTAVIEATVGIDVPTAGF